MEDVDGLIIRSLAKLECFSSFCLQEELPAGLENLSTSDVIEGIIRCLWVCDPKMVDKLPTLELPPSATGRYKIASSISAAMSTIGIAEQFGYQQFLYPSTFDVRRVFLALMGKLPRETMETIRPQLSPLEQLQSEVGEVVRRHFYDDPPWVPDFCRYLKMKYHGRFWHPSGDQPEDYPFSKGGGSKQYDNRSLICTILCEDEEHHADEENTPTAHSLLRFPIEKPKLPPKPQLGVRSSQLQNVTSNDPTQLVHGAESQSAVKEAERTKSINEVVEPELHTRLSALEREYDEKRRRLLEIQYLTAMNEEDIGTLRGELAKRDTRLFKLVEGGGIDDGLRTLQDAIEDVSHRQTELQERFAEMRGTKEMEIRQLREKSAAGADGNEQRDALAKLRGVLERLAESIDHKSKVKAKLEKRAARFTGDESAGNERGGYVKRILEIVANINKQNEEILKTVRLVKRLENEVDNSLAGALSRSFVAVDRWLGESAGGDSHMERAHKFLIRMHKQCESVMTTIREMGQLNRQINSINNEIELEAQQSFEEHWEQLVNDIVQIKADNRAIEKEILQ